ncbi:MAG: response regulator [Planctomycetota bacterium]
MNVQSDDDQLYRVLLVEDDVLDVEIVRRHLGQVRRPRYEIVVAKYLSEALRLLASEEFKAVLLDLNLPDCCSMESVDQLKEAWTAGPIIVLTGLDEECHGVDAIRHGASDYLAKDGLSATLLSRTISHSVERHRMAYWIKATGESKDDYLEEVCNGLRETLSDLLLATSDLVGNDEALDDREYQQVQKIIGYGKRMSELIDDAAPGSSSRQAAAKA